MIAAHFEWRRIEWITSSRANRLLQTQRMQKNYDRQVWYSSRQKKDMMRDYVRESGSRSR